MNIKIKELYLVQEDKDGKFYNDLMLVDEEDKEYIAVTPLEDGRGMKLSLLPKSLAVTKQRVEKTFLND